MLTQKCASHYCSFVLLCDFFDEPSIQGDGYRQNMHFRVMPLCVALGVTPKVEASTAWRSHGERMGFEDVSNAGCQPTEAFNRRGFVNGASRVIPKAMMATNQRAMPIERSWARIPINGGPARKEP